MSGLLCSGNINIGLLNDDGTFLGYMPVKNTVQLEIAQGDSNEKTRVSKKIKDFGQALDTVYTPGATQLTVGLDEHDADIAGMAFRGAVAKLTVAEQANQTATVTLAEGLFMPVRDGAFNLTGVSVTSVPDPEDPDAPVTTYVEGRDYLLDAEAGLVLKIAGGTINGDSVVVKFGVAAYNALQVTPGTKPTINMRLWGRMKNLADGKDIYLSIPKAATYPSSSVDFMSADFAVSTFGGPIQSVNGLDPYTIRYLT